MTGSWNKERQNRAKRGVFACVVTMAMIVASLASIGLVSETAQARGPAYDGPQTQSSGPAYFGPAPNPFPYCDSPTYFDPFPENVSPIGRMDIGDTASVTTDSITMNLAITSEGNPDTQYPGFFPGGGDGSSSDQPKGIELAEGDGASVRLTEPLFYSQWIFTDVDQPNEGFTVTPQWTVPGQAAAFGGDDFFTFAGTTDTAVVLDDTNGEGTASEAIEGRVQVDFLGAVTGIDMLRTFPSNGQSGFAVGGGCEAAGAAKVVVDGPTWNGTSYDVTYELRMRNNLPSSSTIQEVIDDAIGAVGASIVTGTPQGIVLADLQLTDDLRDPAFSDIVVTGLSTAGGLDLNESFDGIDDLNLIDGGVIDAESDELITLSVQYTPDLAAANWDDCVAGYQYLNQTEVTGQAAGVPIADLSDNGVNAAPSNDNGEGGVDDPTPVNFDCPPGALEIVKTVLPGAGATCPTFDLGEPGDGPTLETTVDDVVTYCITVRNPGPGPIWDVSVSDPQGLGTVDLNDLDAGEEDTASFEVTVGLGTPFVNTATVTATDSTGDLGPELDTAVINVVPKDQPLLEIVKSVRPGPNAVCPEFDLGDAGLGTALLVDDQDVVTYCISVRNIGPGDADNVVITDAQAPESYDIGTLVTGEGATVSYDLTVGVDTPTLNTATGTYNGPDGPRDPVDDDAQIDVAPLLPELEIIKSVRAGADADCPDFEGGDPGLGTALAVNDRETVTYCVTVRNVGRGIATDVVITDTQAPAPGTFDIGTLTSGQESTVSYNVTVAVGVTPEVNTASASGNGPNGPLDEPTDQAQIMIDRLPDPGLEIVKTALRGPDADCDSFDDGVLGLGPALQLIETEIVTYCITVRNVGPGPATDVIISDAQGPASFPLNIGDLAAGEQFSTRYDIVTDIADGEATPQVTVNTAGVTGTGLNGPADPDSDDAQISVTLQADPILEIVKSVLAGPDADCPSTFDGGTPGPGDALVVSYGDTVTYCIAVRNVGGNPATTVTVVDDQVAGSLQLGTIPDGEARFASYDVEITPATGLVNTATATGIGPNGPVGPVSDDAVIVPATASLEIVKSVVAGPDGDCPTDFDGGIPGPGDALAVSYGTSVTYCVAVRNTGANPATDVSVADPQADGGVVTIGTIPAGEERLVSYDVEVDANTPLTNTATATGTGPGGADLGPVSDDAVIVPAPAVLEIVKTVITGPNGVCSDFAGGDVGEGTALPVQYTEVVTYCISVRNTGGNPATGVSIADPQAPASFDGLIGTLPQGQERTRSFDLTVNAQTPLRNVAIATGTGPGGAGIPPVSDPANILSTPLPQPALEIVKTVLPGVDATCPSFSDGIQGPGEPLDVLLDGTVTYCIAIVNSGLGIAENVMITDDQAPASSPWDIGRLGPGEGAARQFNLEIGLTTPLTNTAVVTGNGPDDTQLQDSDPAIVNLIDTRSAVISLIHSVSKADEDCITEAKNLNSLVADFETLAIEWCVTITNDGNVDLTDLVLIAPRIGAAEGVDPLEGTGATVLAPGESVTIGFAGEIPETGLISAASVRATPSDADGNPIGLPAVRDDDNAEVREAQILLETTVVAGHDGDCSVAVDLLRVQPDSPITWCYEVMNTGSIDILVTEVNDPTLGIRVPIPPAQQRISPNTSVIVWANDVATDALVNDADVLGRPLDFDGTDLVQAPDLVAEDPAAVEIFEANLAIDKSNSNGGPVPVGTQIDYTLVISNAGPDAAQDVRVTDDLPDGVDYVTIPSQAGWTCSLDADERGFTCLKSEPLAAGASDTLTYSGTTTGTVPSGTDLTNTAQVTSSTPDPDPTDNTDTTTTTTADPPPVTPPPELPEYPGPFTPPTPAPPVALPDEVLGLAITGAASNMLGMISALMLTIGGLFSVGARRKRDEF